MLNKIFLMGRLTRDPELRRTQSGTAVASFALAVDRDYKDQDGQRETDFVDIVAWRSTAEFVSKYFSKGRMAVVEGRLQVRSWTDKDGARPQRWWRTASISATPSGCQILTRRPPQSSGRSRRRRKESCRFDGADRPVFLPQALGLL